MTENDAVRDQIHLWKQQDYRGGLMLPATTFPTAKVLTVQGR